MKYSFIALLLCLSVSSFAQKHRVFADVGWSPGFSVTYNYTPIKHLGVGVGVQAYEYSPTLINTSMFVPAVYADLHLNIRPQKNNQLFLHWDIGMNFYKQKGQYRGGDPRIVYNTPKDNGVCTGGGFGYMRRMTKRGGGPYASLKLVMNLTKVEGYNVATRQTQIKQLNGDGPLVLSLGFKF